MTRITILITALMFLYGVWVGYQHYRPVQQRVHKIQRFTSTGYPLPDGKIDPDADMHFYGDWHLGADQLDLYSNGGGGTVITEEEWK